MAIDLKVEVDLAEEQAQFLVSLEADFDKGTWTFRGEHMKVSAGEFVILPSSVWEQLAGNVRAVAKG